MANIIKLFRHNLRHVVYFPMILTKATPIGRNYVEKSFITLAIGKVITKPKVSHFLTNGPSKLECYITLDAERLAFAKHSRLLGPFISCKKIKCCKCFLSPYNDMMST